MQGNICAMGIEICSCHAQRIINQGAILVLIKVREIKEDMVPSVAKECEIRADVRGERGLRERVL
jgi:hypothetical protein